MESNIVFNVAFDISEIISLVLMFVSCVMDHSSNDRHSKLFSHLLLIAIVQLSLDIATHLIRGNVLIPWVVYLLNEMLFAAGYLLAMAFASYLCEVIKIDKRIKWIFLRIVHIGGVVFILIAATNSVTHIFFSVVDGLYQRSPLFLISQCYHGIVLAVCAIIILKKRMPIREKFALVSYCILPFVGITLQTIFYGTNFSYIVIPISLQIVYINVHVSRGKIIAEQKSELTQARIAIMLSQIQPHFLYNSLTAIMDMCGSDSENARNAISDFAEYLRGNLDSLQNNRPIFFNDELEHLEIYLRFEKIRFEEKLDVIYNIKVRDFMLPALTVQPLVENAVKHGICKKSGGGTVTVSTEECGNSFVISVSDNGVGFDTNEERNDGRTHIGISNIRSRIENMCGGTLEVTSKIGVGTTAIIKIPKSACKNSHK